MNRKILVCDDDEGILDMLSMILEDAGFEVIAEICSLNLQRLITQTQPDLLLMDLWMPVLSGDQVLRAIKQDPVTKNLPVIIISASIDGKRIARQAGADQYIAKPFNIDDLIDVVNKQLDTELSN